MAEPGLCETCGAFYGANRDPEGNLFGSCGLEVIQAPVPGTATCSRYRLRGTSGPAPRARAAGEPRRRSSGGTNSGVRDRLVDSQARQPLPQEIDIEMDIEDFRRVLREVISDELGISNPALGQRWEGGELVLKPGKDGTQEKRVPIETFFHKIVMVRDKLRLLEAKLNSHTGLSAEDKVQLQAYITGCYGSLTTFNLLFAEKDDQISGQNSG